jgi:hypothetical protein
MPLCARLASPGRGMPAPPPIRPASEMVWWGERKGRLWRSSAPRADRDGQRAAHGAYGAIEGEFADEDVPIPTGRSKRTTRVSTRPDNSRTGTSGTMSTKSTGH